MDPHYSSAHRNPDLGEFIEFLLQKLVNDPTGPRIKHAIEANVVGVCLSGGIDSTTLLAGVIKRYPHAIVVGITFKYPSKHNNLERAAAARIAKYYCINLITIDLRTPFQHYRSSLISGKAAIPEGHYKEDTMKSTVVPLRNLIFATTAASKLIDIFPNAKKMAVAIGVHAGDHAIYPDCRPDTIARLGSAITNGTDDVVRLMAPFLEIDKATIVNEGIHAEVPFRLTRTCYTSGELACGKCGACIERLEAFAMNNTRDPIQYKDYVKGHGGRN